MWRPHSIPQRTIEIADFELPRGAVSIQRLLALPRATWEHLRAEINRRRRADPDRPLARCRLCKGPIFIRAQVLHGEHSPVYAHYPESPVDCPWHQGGTLTPDDARAAQYRGHQESALHRWMCDTIAQVASADPRCKLVRIDTYRRPAIETRGRWPDVYLEIEGLGQFAIEAQLSKPFAPEIAARHLHYEREGVALLWAFRELEANLSQGFRDVITMQRGNAFVFDDAAVTASSARQTLVLNCYLESERGGFLKPKLVPLDDLDISSGRSVFLSDRRSDRLLEFCKDGRSKWWEGLKAAPPSDFDYPFDEPCFHSAWDSVRMFVPALSDWKQRYWQTQFARGDRHFAELVAILFSIAHSAATETDRLYVTRYKGEGSLIAMLNSKLASAAFAPYANLIETMLAGSAARDRLERASLRDALGRAQAQGGQVTLDHPVWAGAQRLFPEIFDGLRRAELADLGKLPRWAGGSSASIASAIG